MQTDKWIDKSRKRKKIGVFTQDSKGTKRQNQHFLLVDVSIITCYAHESVLITDEERKLKELFDKAIDESKKKRLTINCKNLKCKRDNPKWKLYIGEQKWSRYRNVTIWVFFFHFWVSAEKFLAQQEALTKFWCLVRFWDPVINMCDVLSLEPHIFLVFY